MKKQLFALVSLMLAGGCASTATPYKQGDFWSEAGYSHVKQADDRYEVNFTGNNHTDEKMAEDLALMRAAELCQGAGYEQVRQFSRSVTYFQDMGFNAPIGQVDVQCLHDPAADTRPAGDIIAEARATYPQAMPKAGTKPG